MYNTNLAKGILLFCNLKQGIYRYRNPKWNFLSTGRPTCISPINSLQKPKLEHAGQASIYNLIHQKYLSTSSTMLAGHSKWQNIKHIKAAKDKEKGTAFQKFAKQIMLATKEPGGTNPEFNSKLARVIAIAKDSNMPMSSIERAIKKSEAQAQNAKPHTVVLVGPGGLYIAVDLVTDKLVRIRQMLISTAKKIGLREDRSLTNNLYEEKGVLVATGKNEDLSTATDHAIECGAEDVSFEEGYFTFYCDPFDFVKVKKNLEEQKYLFEYADVDKLPTTYAAIKESDTKNFQKALEKIEAMEEVSKVHINFTL